MNNYKTNKPTLGAKYPEIEFTESTLGSGDLPRDRVGLADSKRFYDKWKAYINPNAMALETIKLMRYLYALGYNMAIDDIKNNRGHMRLEVINQEKTYTAKEVQNAYKEGIRRGLLLWKHAIDDAANNVATAYEDASHLMNAIADDKEQLQKDADEMVKECNCDICREKRGETPSEELKGVFKAGDKPNGTVEFI